MRSREVGNGVRVPRVTLTGVGRWVGHSSNSVNVWYTAQLWWFYIPDIRTTAMIPYTN